MKTEDIFRNLCEFRNKAQESGAGMSPDEMRKRGVSIVSEDNTGDVISRDKFIGDDGGYVIEEYWFSDHCRTFEVRPDTNHFNIFLCDVAGNVIDKKNYSYDDDV